jgi:hypothetical protein
VKRYRDWRGEGDLVEHGDGSCYKESVESEEWGVKRYRDWRGEGDGTEHLLWVITERV